MSLVYMVLSYLGLILLLILITFYAERKLAAFIQDRLGPMEVGKYGLLQPIADLIKLLQKENILPEKADKFLFLAAPVMVFPIVFASFALLPLHSNWVASKAETGVLLLLAIVSLDVIVLLIAGWASNSKFSTLGGLRAAAQLISYEIPLGLSLLCVIILSQSLNLQEIAFQQGIFSNESHYLFGIKTWQISSNQIGGFLSWNIFNMPILIIAYIIFFICSLAESNRAPFDIPEGESEIIGGFHTEYSGFRFSLFFLAEYAVMVLVSMLGVTLFLGAWNSPFPNIGMLKLADWTSGTPGTWSGNLWGLFWLSLKTILVLLLKVVIRWTYPRLRVDQLMNLSWKVLTPIALFLVFLSGFWRLMLF